MNSDSAHPHDERRKHKRARASFIVSYSFRKPVPVELKSADRHFTAVAVDISAGGMGVVINEALPIHATLQISFTLVNETPGPDLEMRRWFELRGKPLHCTLKPRAGYHAGIQFENVPLEDKQFIAEYVESHNRPAEPPASAEGK